MQPLKEMHNKSIFNNKSDDISNTKIEEKIFKSLGINDGLDFEIDGIIDNLLNIQEKTEDEDTRERKQPKRDMKGKSVFLEATGEKIGTVFDMVYDGEGSLVAYKIKDNKSEAVLSFPADQFDEHKNGLIFVPSWYIQGIKTIEELEFRDRISPELTWLLADNTFSGEELYNMFVKHDDKIASYMEKATILKEMLKNRLKILERERVKLKEDLMELTEKRLIKDIDRRRFSEIVMEHRHKANVLDINIKKCKELIERLEHTSFGYIIE